MTFLPAAVSSQRSTKRGLVNIASSGTAAQDDAVLLGGNSDLTWYYNYGSEPTSYLANSGLNFVPQCWGPPGTTFLSNVTAQISNGANITAVLGFNEPDGCDNGGACISPYVAATYWIDQIEPLKEHGIKLGSPAPTGSPRGLEWMAQWFAACNGGCNPDFLALHWYGDIEGLASWIGQVNASYLVNITDGIWITEFALENSDLGSTQSFYNHSTSYLDSLSYIDRYSYFGSFRSDVSNVGPNVAMLDGYGKLTDIGSWYKGDSSTGVVPSTSGNSTTSVATIVVSPRTVFLSLLLGLVFAVV